MGTRLCTLSFSERVLSGYELRLTATSRTSQPCLGKETFGTPADAVRRITTNDKVQYIPEKGVRRIDWETLGNLIQTKLHKDFSVLGPDEKPAPLLIQVPLYTLKPEVTLDSLRQEGIDRKIIQFSTGLGNSSEGRIHNVSAAAEAINGMILPPDATFDYEKVVRKAEKEYGFREAPVIVNGRLTPGIGGESARYPVRCITQRY